MFPHSMAGHDGLFVPGRTRFRYIFGVANFGVHTMTALLIALVLIAVSVTGVYLLLKSMGRDGVEAAAPGSCKSGSCGVQPRQTGEESPPLVEVQHVRIDEIKRKDALSNNQLL